MIGSIIRGNLRIKSLLGSGAMGSVYLAENTNLADIQYAVKVLRNELTHDPSFQERFFVEAKNQCQLDHPNIVQVQDFFQHDGAYCLLLAYVPGKPLDVLIQEKGRLPEKEALAIFSGILQALDCAHKRGIVHRDVKPGNVLIDRDGRARLTDFGIAIQVGHTRLTGTGRAVGTPVYMSPEQVTNPQNIDQRSDVYSAGVVLFEMLTGKIPFDGPTEFAIEEQVVNKEPPNPKAFNREIPDALARIILKALSKDPNRRYAGCGAFLKAIRDYRWPPRNNWLIAAAVGAALIGVGGFAWKYFHPDVIVETKEVEVKDPDPLVQAATNEFGLLCFAAANLTIAEKRKYQAEQIGESAYADEYTKQATGFRSKIHQSATKYLDYLSELSDISKISEIAAGKVGTALRQVHLSPDGEWFRPYLTEDFGKSGGGHPPTEEEMVTRCPKTTKG